MPLHLFSAFHNYRILFVHIFLLVIFFALTGHIFLKSNLSIETLNIANSTNASVTNISDDDSSLSDWWMVALTAAITLVTAGQAVMFYKQLAFMRVSLKDTEKAADAAFKSAEAFQVVERAHLWVEEMKGECVEDGVIKIAYKISNTGNTPGIVHRVPLVCFFGVKPFEDPPEYPDSKNDNVIFVPAKEEIWWPGIPLRLEEKLNSQQAKAVIDEEFPVWVAGRLEYVDIFDKIHVSGFCYKLSFSKGNTKDRFAKAKYWRYS